MTVSKRPPTPDNDRPPGCPNPAAPRPDSIEAHIQIQNQLGLHARPAMSFVDVANMFMSEIRVFKDTHEVDGKSIMQVMMLAAGQGTQLRIRAQGPDAQAAIEALKELVDRKFDEE